MFNGIHSSALRQGKEITSPFPRLNEKAAFALCKSGHHILAVSELPLWIQAQPLHQSCHGKFHETVEVVAKLDQLKLCLLSETTTTT